MFHRALAPPDSTFFLFGLRGVGKTTWARDTFREAIWVDLLQEPVYHAHLVDPKLFRRTLSAVIAPDWVVVDEVQRVPALLNEVHSLIEERKLRFVLLGSGARKLRRAGVNLLGGRALRRTLWPLLPTEMGHAFSLESTLRFGSVPLVTASSSPLERLEAYTHLYLKEEIQAEALVRNLAGFARFLPVAALFHGQVLNVGALARDCGVARTTVQGYLDILEDTMLAFRLPAFEGRLRVKERRHPKLYWTDPGIVRAAKKQLHPVTSDERGALLEGLIASWLLAYRDYRRIDFDTLSYWAVGAGSRTEVDFVLHRGNAAMAIEVKASERLREEHFAGLSAIGALAGLKRRILVYLGESEQRHENGIEVWPLQKFVEALDRGFDWT